MASHARSLLLGIAALSILALIGMVGFVPPDGREHAELAQFLGRFHLLIIHFPIALLLLALLLALAALATGRAALRQSGDFVLVLATAGTITAAWFGWLLAWSEEATRVPSSETTCGVALR